MSSEKHQILKQLRSLLCYHDLSDIGGYPKSTEVLDFLSASYLPDNSQDSTIEKTRKVVKANKLPKSPVVPQLDVICEIANEVKVCRSCDLFKGRISSVPGEGGEEVRLLIVGGWLTALTSGDVDDSSVFGNDEDQMLLRMLSAIHLPQNMTFVTNVIKCGITPSVQPKKENVDICVSYLHRQIAALSPDVICSMGLIATRALILSSKPLSQLRGRFHEYEEYKEKKIAIMPTYHPSFLLKNPEMKMATWNDLQLIEKKLKS